MEAIVCYKFTSRTLLTWRVSPSSWNRSSLLLPIGHQVFWIHRRNRLPQFHCWPPPLITITHFMLNYINIISTENAFNEKKMHQKEFIYSPGPDSTFMPLSILTIGECHREAHEYLNTLAKDLASRLMANRTASRATLYNRNATFLNQNNAKWISKGRMEHIRHWKLHTQQSHSDRYHGWFLWYLKIKYFTNI